MSNYIKECRIPNPILRVGVFFDGTMNNTDNSDSTKEEYQNEASYENNYSNICSVSP